MNKTTTKSFKDRLKLSYDSIDNTTEEFVITRQHVNLSEYAWSIIDDDRHSFEQAEIPLATFMSNIFVNYHPHAPVNLNTFRENLAQKLQSRYNINKPESYKIFDTFLEYSTLQQYNNYPENENGVGKKIYLNKAITNILMSIDDSTPIAKHYKRPGKYLSALFEAYSKCSRAEREAIYYNELINNLESYIKDKKITNITIENDGKQSVYPVQKITNITIENGEKHAVYPIKIGRDKYNLHMYLVAVVMDEIDENDINNGKYKHYICTNLRPVSFRISRIKYACNNELAIYSTPDYDKEHVELSDIEYLASSSTKITVKFTDKGLSLLNRITFRKPTIIEPVKNDKYKLRFTCTEYQAQLYFRQFGKEAVVLEPKSLYNKLKKMYQDGAKAYEEEQV